MGRGRGSGRGVRGRQGGGACDLGIANRLAVYPYVEGGRYAFEADDDTLAGPM